MRTLGLLSAVAAFALAVASAQAQAPSSGAGVPPAGKGPPPKDAAAPGPHGPGPHGPGMGHGMRGGPDDTRGWAMMSPEERQAHHARMMGFTSAKACRAYVDQHHRQMVERAKARGVAMPAVPRHDPCAGLKD